MRCKLIVAVAIIAAWVMQVAGGNARTATKLETTNDPTTAREQLWYNVPLQFNKVCDDLDTAFAHLGSVYGDSLYKAAVKTLRGYITRLTASDVIIEDSVNVDNVIASYLNVSNIDASGTTTTDSLYVGGTAAIDSLILNVGGVQSENIDAADKFIWLNVNGTRYKLMLKAE